MLVDELIAQDGGPDTESGAPGGFGIVDSRPSIELSYRIRHDAITGARPPADLRAAAMPPVAESRLR